MFETPAVVEFVGNMALQLTQKLTVYVHGNDQLAEDIQGAMVKPRTRIAFETRKIMTLALAREGSSEMILTFEDGTQTREAFLVRDLRCEEEAVQGSPS